MAQKGKGTTKTGHKTPGVNRSASKKGAKAVKSGVKTAAKSARKEAGKTVKTVGDKGPEGPGTMTTANVTSADAGTAETEPPKKKKKSVKIGTLTLKFKCVQADGSGDEEKVYAVVLNPVEGEFFAGTPGGQIKLGAVAGGFGEQFEVGKEYNVTISE